MNRSDEEFKEALREYLTEASGAEKPVVPIFYNEDRSINREKTLALPCFAGFKEENGGSI